MNLESMFYISQTIAAVAIVASLLFVAAEVRSSNRESRHRTVEELLQNSRVLQLEIAGNADLARVWVGGLADFAGLDPVDKARFTLTAHCYFKTMESLLLAYRDGYAKREIYEPTLSNLSDFIAYPGLQAVWEIRKHYFHVALRDLVSERISAAKISAAPALYREKNREAPK
jgi:hypothetical protein